MKAKFLVADTEDSENTEWRDLYFDEDKLSLYWLPDLLEDEDKSINVVIDGNKYTLKQESKTLAFIIKKFKIK